MKVMRIGVDLAKNVFQVHGVDGNEQPFWRRQLSRARWVAAVTAKLAPGGEIGIDLSNTERSGLSYAYIPINDVDRAPVLDFNYALNSSTSRPVFVRAQTIVSNDGEFLASS